MSPETFRGRVARRIQRARWRLGWTQADAAHRIGLTFRYYAEIERGRRNPTLDVIFSIGRGLKVRVVDLIDVESGPRVDLDALELAPPPTGRKRTGMPKRSERR